MADVERNWGRPDGQLSQAAAVDVLASALRQAGRCSTHAGDAAIIRAEAARIVALLEASNHRLIAV